MGYIGQAERIGVEILSRVWCCESHYKHGVGVL